MNVEKLTTIPDPNQELDDPYVHTVSTEEFVEAVERTSQEEKNDGLTPNEEDWFVLTKPWTHSLLLYVSSLYRSRAFGQL